MEIIHTSLFVFSQIFFYYFLGVILGKLCPLQMNFLLCHTTDTVKPLKLKALALGVQPEMFKMPNFD